MRNVTFAAALCIVFGSGMAMADTRGEGGGGGDDHDCPACHEKTKPVCMNLKCDYKFRHHDKDINCAVVTVFNKTVTEDGGEVSDVSGKDDDVKMEIACEGTPIWNGPARRFTDLLGTRIQGEQGPNPAITLPRGVLHSNEDGKGAGHYSHSRLELQTDEGWKRADGACFIWSGNP